MLSTSLMPTRSAEIKSRCCSERSKGQLRTIGYSSAEGLSALATVGFSLFTCGWSAPVCVFAGLGAAAVRFGAAYYFNGPSIMEYGSTASVENRSPSYHSGDTIETYEAPRPSCCTNFFSISAQGAFLALDTAQNFADRFFLLTACIKLLGATLSPGAFWGIVLSELAIKDVAVVPAQ